MVAVAASEQMAVVHAAVLVGSVRLAAPGQREGAGP
jgi:hypothetical protein